MVQGALKKLVTTSFPNRDELNYVCLDMGVTTLLELANELEALPLGYERKCVVAENCFFLAKSRSKTKLQKGDDDGPFKAFLDNPNPDIDLFLLVYSDTLEERSPYYQALLKDSAKINPVKEFTPQEWREFIPRYFEKRGSTIAPSAVNEILARIQGDYALFLCEGQKLLAYAAGGEITLESVRLLVNEPLEDDAFHLSNALSKGDVKGALSIYRDLRTQGVEPVSLTRLLANQFRFLNEVRYLGGQGLSNGAIASKLQASSFRVNIALDNLRKMKDESLNQALEGLYQCEYSIMSGKLDASLAFSLFLANFSL